MINEASGEVRLLKESRVRRENSSSNLEETQRNGRVGKRARQETEGKVSEVGGERGGTLATAEKHGPHLGQSNGNRSCLLG